MSRFRAVHYLLCLVLLVGMLGCLVGNRVVLATQETSNGSFLLSPNQEQTSPEEKLELVCKYPVLLGKSGESFDFGVELIWHSSGPRQFDIKATGPSNWSISILGGYAKTEIGGRIGLVPVKPGETYPTETVSVKLEPLEGSNPKPGDYPVTLEVSSGKIKEAIELKAVVTAINKFAFHTADWRVNTEVTAGEDNHLSLTLENTGTATIDKISCASNKPSDWKITYNPEDVNSLEPGAVRETDVVIKPPSKTIAGDYMVTLQAYSLGLPYREVELRVTVLTPMTGLWVGVIVVLAVIVGLAVMFRRLGRR